MLLEPHDSVVAAPPGPVRLPAATDHLAVRRALRAQIARLEAQLADCVHLRSQATALVVGGPAPGAAVRPAPRMLDVGALEALRDDLAERLRRVRREQEREGIEREGHRRQLEDMLARPRAYKWHRVAAADLGEPGCGVWQVRPRLGIIGMLAGWWHVKVSSGCPLAGAAPSSIPPLHYDHPVGKRSRKRSSTGEAPPPVVPASPASERAPATVRPRARADEAPEAPWGSFPLVELCIFAGIVLVVWGFLADGSQSEVLIVGGVALICVASLELTIREHLAGFRSHTTLLSVMCAVAVMAPLFFAQVARGIMVAAGVVAGALAYGILRRIFVRRAGGLGFRA